LLAPINKERLMFRMNRPRPGFDWFETDSLLSTGLATVSRSAHLETAPVHTLELNGTLHGNKTVLSLDAGLSAPGHSDGANGTLSYFDTSGRLSTLGKVSGSFGPNEATDSPIGHLPNLSNLTLELSNHAGSVQLTLSPSSTSHYQFRVSGGTGSYAAAYGSGSLSITFRASANEYLLRLTSAKS
jgi:hypothetical protein